MTNPKLDEDELDLVENFFKESQELWHEFEIPTSYGQRYWRWKNVERNIEANLRRKKSECNSLNYQLGQVRLELEDSRFYN